MSEPAKTAVPIGALPAGTAPTRGAGARAREETATVAAQTAITDRDEGRPLLARLLDELTPPEPWRHRPAAPAELWRYAKRGEWTGEHGPMRTAGVWWCRTVTLPATLVTHYLAWIAARPSRVLAAAGLWAVLMHTPLRGPIDAVLPWDAWPTWLP
jgi:hypothetical protein